MPSFADSWAKLLEKAGYVVLRSYSIEEAEESLANRNIHLSILDIRMLDEDDPNDISGLKLAQKREYESIPKIMLTAYPTYSYVRDAMGFAEGGFKPAINFLSKAEGPKALVEAVRLAFNDHLRINWDLVIQTNDAAPLTFAYLAGLLDSTLSGDRLPDRSEEMEDLFRRLFYESEQIRIERLLWRCEERAALLVFSFDRDNKCRPLLVVCGRKGNARVSAYSKNAVELPDNCGTAFVRTAETFRYWATAYRLNGADLEDVFTLSELYRSGSERALLAAIDSLLENTLVCWRRSGRKVCEDQLLDEVYRGLAGLQVDQASMAALEERILFVFREAEIKLGLRLELNSESLMLHVGGEPLSYPNPVAVVIRGLRENRPYALVSTPGFFSTENIAVDGDGRVWLTDFARAGTVPELWDYISLEAILRFDLVDAKKGEWICELESLLSNEGFSKPDPSEVEPSLRRAVRAIQVVRRHAAPIIGTDYRAYHRGIVLQATSRIASYDKKFRLTRREIARLTHCAIAISTIGEAVAQDNKEAVPAALHRKGISIEGTSVWVEGANIKLRGQSYQLLKFLHDRANEACSRRDLVENVFGLKYDELDPSQVSRLNTAIRRLRELIEINPDSPRYLLTEQGVGYKLVLHH